MAYIRGLISTIERKNGWQLAELAEKSRQTGCKRLLNTAKWMRTRCVNDLQEYILTHLIDPEAVLVVDETGFSKRHQVSRRGSQYTGTVGRSPIARLGSFWRMPTDMERFARSELYLHRDWEKESERCKEAEVPEERRTTLPSRR